ncbi:DUF6691 family protein [Sandaracinus amylolyticus]|uniref:DUF6691 family protein n=1 Tax=Sandaracinus amylolyticus TaxID=927083 RepID=UPI001F43AAB7|nr:DUF6691 family protein [Sandaracinus amylolyticus]UJR84512.1 Hypothetical protein I5071_65910 [Sandaracinus amylolyticus]
MDARTKQGLAAFAAGALFAIGLVVGGMTEPANVIGFLDVTGDWRPALMFVMVGAIAVNASVYRWVRRRRAPLLAETFALPTRRDLDRRLLAGAALFGVGWGLGGYCPGPGVTALASGSISAVVFVLAMVGSMWVVGWVERSHATPDA